VKGTPHLVNLLSQESGSFQRIDNVWRPTNLFFAIQTQELLKDMLRRHQSLELLKGELQLLERSEMYLKNLRSMGFIIRRAKFVRLVNQLAFSKAVSDFYTAYGTVLRFLKIDQARGRLQQESVT
jgi:hypothetical protein